MLYHACVKFIVKWHITLRIEINNTGDIKRNHIADKLIYNAGEFRMLNHTEESLYHHAGDFLFE